MPSDVQGIDRFQALMQSSLDALYCLEPEASDQPTPDFRFTDVNPPGEALMQLPADELLGKTIRDIFSPANADVLSRSLAKVHASDASEEFEVTLTDNADPHVMRMQVVPLSGELFVKAYDVTASRDAQEALRRSEEYLSSVMANAPIIFYELDRDGVFKLSTGLSLSQIGLSPGEAVGGSIYDYFSAGSPEVEAFGRALLGETVSTSTQLGDGYFASRYTPRVDDTGNIVGVLGVSYDITEQHLAEEQLRRAQRMEAVGQLTGGIAHDFNNLLAVILGNLDLLSDLQAEESRGLQLIEQAVAATERGASLTKRLLAFSRRQLLEPHAIDANELLDSMLELLERAIPENIEIVYEPGTDLWATNVDIAQLENAILNLAVNARDAMPSGGSLTISSDNMIVDAELAERAEITPGSYVALSVADTGVGIAPDVMKQIFEPFFTTKEVGKGSGLGLSMVYGFVNQSGGGIEVESEMGKGTRLTLFLPRAEDGVTTSVQTASAASDLVAGHEELILVVEDDADLRRFVTQAMASLNYQTVEAGDGQEALELLEQRADIKLIVSDIILPGDINGVDLYKRVRLTRPDMKMILTTGYVGDMGKVDTQAIAEVELIPKPYRLAELGQKVHHALSD